MNRILLLTAIACLTFLVILFFSRVDLAKDFWLWLVGLAGPIVKSADLLITKLKNILSPPVTVTPVENKETINEQ